MINYTQARTYLLSQGLTDLPQAVLSNYSHQELIWLLGPFLRKLYWFVDTTGHKPLASLAVEGYI
jgi:hypothetical protein